MFAARSFIDQRRRIHLGVDEFGIAHLHDAWQSQAHLVDEFRTRRRPRLGHHDFHAVIHFDKLKMRHLGVTEKMIAPRLLAVTGVAMENADMCRVGGVLEEIEPIVIGVTHRFDLPLPAAVKQRRIVR